MIYVDIILKDKEKIEVLDSVISVDVHIVDKGEQGKQGEKPVKGKDYWTEEDKEQIKKEIEETIGSGLSFEIVDKDKVGETENNTIIFVKR